MTDQPEDFQQHAAIECLFGDTVEASRALIESDSQFNRRSYVRTFYTGAEAYINWLKQLCLRLHNQSPVAQWSSADIAALREETYYVDDKGIARSQVKFIPTDSNLRFVVQLLNKLPRSSYGIDWAGVEWRDFKDGLRVRNRLTHPKTKKELSVSDGELTSVRNAHRFIVGLFFQPVYDHIQERDAQKGV